MGVYLVNQEFNPLTSIFQTVTINKQVVTSGDGLLYYIQENPLEFVEENHESLNAGQFEELVEAIQMCQWMNNKKSLINKLECFIKRQKWDLAKDIGDHYFEQQNFQKALDYYISFIEIYHKLDEQEKSSISGEDQIYCNIGIILMTIGEVKEGIELMEYAYGLKQSPKIQLQLIKYQMEFNSIHDLSKVEAIVNDILSHPSKDEQLSFLVWYYHYIGDLESSVTSYMQLTNINLRFKLVDYYMVYMLESNQQIAMESFLKPLKETDEFMYQTKLIQVFIDLKQYEEALTIIDQTTRTSDQCNFMNILKSICNLGLKRIIESIRAINEIKEESLNEQDKESYYIQLMKLSKYSKDLSKEYKYNQQLLFFWQQKYRKIYARVLHNMKWKVNQ